MELGLSVGAGVIPGNNGILDLEEIDLGDMVVPFNNKAFDRDNKSMSSKKSKQSSVANVNLQSFQMPLGASLGGGLANELFVL